MPITFNKSLNNNPPPLRSEDAVFTETKKPDWISNLPDEIKLHIFGFLDILDIKDILSMSEVAKAFYLLAKNNLFWKQKAIQIGIPEKDLTNATSSNIKNRFAEISAIAKSLHPSTSESDFITIESLKNNLSEINNKKCSDFLRVWQKIIEKLSSADLSIPEKAKTIKNPNELDKMFSEWLEDNKDSINSITFLSLANLNLSFLPTSIGALGKLKKLYLNQDKVEENVFLFLIF